MLYGPVEKEQAHKAAVEGLKPFGNDRFLLHTVERPRWAGTAFTGIRRQP